MNWPGLPHFATYLPFLVNSWIRSLFESATYT